MAIQAVGEIGGALFSEHRRQVKEGKAMNLKSGLFSNDVCLDPVGTLRIHEPEQSAWSEFGLSAPTRVLQAIVNESNCFRVLDRSAGFDAAQQERALAMTGQLANGQSLAGAQMLGADYVLVPGIIGQNAKAGGSAVSASNLLGGIGLKSRKKTAEVVLTLMDVRTSEQIISVTGEAKIADLSLSASAQDGSGNAASASSWSNTEIGKVIRKAYEDSYTKMIREVGKKDLLARYQPQEITQNAQAAANQMLENGVQQAQQLASQAAPHIQQAAASLQATSATAIQAASVVNNAAAMTQQLASNVAAEPLAQASAEINAELLQAETLELRRRARLFSQASIQSGVVADMHQGMLVYPQGQAENGMLKVEDELGNIGWLPVANLQRPNQ